MGKEYIKNYNKKYYTERKARSAKIIAEGRKKDPPDDPLNLHQTL